MLDELRVRDLGVLEEVDLRLGPGLTVVTGETGAGKTMLVTALQLLRGGKAPRRGRQGGGIVRAGADGALVEARFTTANDAASDAARDAAGVVDADEDVWANGEVVVAREVLPTGRSRARVNGRLAPIAALDDAIGAHVDIHAQHEHLRLASPAVQRDLVDGFAGAEHLELVATYRDRHRAWRHAVEERDRIVADEQQRARRMDLLQFELEQIDAVGLDPTADADLGERLARAESAGDLRDTAAGVVGALADDGGASDAIGVAVELLRRAQAPDEELDDLRARMETLAVDVAELAGDARAWGESLQVDPAEITRLRRRRRAIRALERKYGADLEAILRERDAAADELQRLSNADADLGRLAHEIEVLEGELRDLGARVSVGRGAAAAVMAEAVSGHLADLGMPHARFTITVDRAGQDAPGPYGFDDIAFVLAANPGEPGGPLEDVASGGERSRIALAIAVVASDLAGADVLVFDEVDAGIGGQTAMQVGAKLAALAGPDRQVLAVTHLAQLAAFADDHYVAEKSLVDGDRTVTTIRRVTDEERVDELQRMLSGDHGGDAAHDHAARLLVEAGGARTR